MATYKIRYNLAILLVGALLGGVAVSTIPDAVAGSGTITFVGERTIKKGARMVDKPPTKYLPRGTKELTRTLHTSSIPRASALQPFDSKTAHAGSLLAQGARGLKVGTAHVDAEELIMGGYLHESPLFVSVYHKGEPFMVDCAMETSSSFELTINQAPHLCREATEYRIVSVQDL